MQATTPRPGGMMMPSGQMNSQAMIDNFKSMAMTMMMFKNTNGSSANGNDSSSFINTIIMMLVISFIDTIALHIKQFFASLMRHFNAQMCKTTTDLSILKSLTNSVLTKTKRACIFIKIEPATATRNPTSDAIIDLLTHFPHTKSILLQNGVFNINYSEEIEINKNLFARIVGSARFQEEVMLKSKTKTNKPQSNSNNVNTNLINETMIGNSNSNEDATTAVAEEQDSTGGAQALRFIEVYSYTYDMEVLRKEVNDIVNNYLVKMNNKLGNNLFYFTELPCTVYKDSQNKTDHSKLPETLHFRMKQFVTNRSFKNLFGTDINLIRRRVEFFRDNKDWYDNKGVPYTLGIMVSGTPGTGKTSVIKCIANELKRHIINVHLSDNMSKTQFENLFYNDQLHVTQNGKTETFVIPINKRIYVLEDIDCQCNVILDRGSENFEQKLIRDNQLLQKEVERLKFALDELSNGKKFVVGSGGNVPQKQDNKDNTKDVEDKITLSFLLNLFDGVLETPGRIVIMTTNFIDKLDKAFTRPGRIDICCKLDFVDFNQLKEIVEHRYDATLTEEQQQTLQNLPKCISPAEVGRILFENFDNLEGAIEGLQHFATQYLAIEEKKKQEYEEAKLLKALEEPTKEKDTPPPPPPPPECYEPSSSSFGFASTF